MTPLFVDTSAWVALADAGDKYHADAVAFRDELPTTRQLVTTNYVLDELLTVLLIDVGYPYAVAFKRKLDVLHGEGILEIVWVTEELADKAWAVFERFNIDKEWSFTDCASYVVMRDRGIGEAFAFDHHFAQMGFLQLPTPL